MEPARYIFLNADLRMSTGKASSQAAHAEMFAMYDFLSRSQVETSPWLTEQRNLFQRWYGYGHYAKLIVAAQDSIQMYTMKLYLEERGFKTYMVIDEGRTEQTYFVPTALSVELVDRDIERVQAIFGEFKLYKDPALVTPTNGALDRLWHWITGQCRR